MDIDVDLSSPYFTEYVCNNMALLISSLVYKNLFRVTVFRPCEFSEVAVLSG